MGAAPGALSLSEVMPGFSGPLCPAPPRTPPGPISKVRLSKLVARVTGRTAQELEPLHDYLGFMPVRALCALGHLLAARARV